MVSILLIKTSSLGDVVHNLPVVSDIRKHLPDARIDWVVEEPYAELARLHPGLRSVIPVALRRWRRQLFQDRTWREFQAFRATIAGLEYDHIIDTQGLLKSAWLCRLAHGRRHGYDRLSAREPLAAAFYDERHGVSWNQHAVSRNRQLVGMSLGLVPGQEVDFGIGNRHSVTVNDPFCVLLHGSARRSKLWPVDSWRALVAGIANQGRRCILPWGTEEELGRSKSIATGHEYATVPDRMELSGIVDLLGRASVVVGVDTGLLHLAAALGRPTIALFTGHDRQSRPGATGIFGAASGINLGGQGDGPAPGEVLAAMACLDPR